ncbi:NodB-like y domain-containing protein [Cupriavidus oxalaticus]|uniref:polysaccharide deacetylase family protein n=1 Tax=Cupriavidus oxalaticus TaxID=96344 RepID=UPI003F73D4AF
MQTKYWGPGRKRAAVSITLDNFGEAADIALARWPADAPIGQHYTATEVLPGLFADLGKTPVTYFIEAVNAERYPRQLQAIRDAGHEIGLHGWEHENWQALDARGQRASLQRSLAAMHAIGVRPVGFRPPGGRISAEGMALLRESGFSYCSPASAQFGDYTEQGLQVLPFHWHQVDAYLIDADLAAFRAENGDRAAPATADEWRALLQGRWEAALSQGEHLTAIFHPYLFGPDPQLQKVLVDFIDQVTARDDVWVAPAATVANWLAESQSRTATGIA